MSYLFYSFHPNAFIIEHRFIGEDCDERVCVLENNWFEVFIGHGEGDPGPTAECVDVENLTPEQLFGKLLEWANMYDD